MCAGITRTKRIRSLLFISLTVSIGAGGRTAWSCTVTVQGRTFSARFFYDSQYIDNAKDDASEIALNSLIPQSAAFFPQRGFAQ